MHTHSTNGRNPFAAALLAASCLLGMASVSSGALVTVDPTIVAPGTNLSNPAPGVTLSAPGNPNGTSVFSIGQNALSVLGNAFGNSAGGVNLSSGWSAALPLRADFAPTATSVTIGFTLDGFPGGAGRANLLAFNAANVQIGIQQSSGVGDFVGDLTLSVAGIHHIVAFYSGSTAGYDFVIINRLSFTPAAAAAAVPEPGSALAGMLALGACAGGLVRRNRQGAVRA